MAKLGQTYKTSEISEMNAFDVLPPATYKMMVTDSKWKDTSKGDGRMLVLEMDVQDGQYTGRKLFINLNLENPNASAVEIATKEIGALGRALGIEDLQDSEQLHNKMFLAEVKVRKGKEYKDKNTGELKQGFDQNSIGKYLPLNAKKTPPAAAASDDAADEAAATPASKKEAVKGKTPAWKQKKETAAAE